MIYLKTGKITILITKVGEFTQNKKHKIPRKIQKNFYFWGCYDSVLSFLVLQPRTFYQLDVSVIYFALGIFFIERCTYIGIQIYRNYLIEVIDTNHFNVCAPHTFSITIFLTINEICINKSKLYYFIRCKYTQAQIYVGAYTDITISKHVPFCWKMVEILKPSFFGLILVIPFLGSGSRSVLKQRW